MIRIGILSTIATIILCSSSVAFAEVYKLKGDFDGDLIEDVVKVDISKQGNKITFNTNFATNLAVNFSKKIPDYWRIYAANVDLHPGAEIVGVRKDGKKYTLIAYDVFGNKISKQNLNGNQFKLFKTTSSSFFNFPVISNLDKVCKKIRGFVNGEIWKSEASAHIPSHDPRSGSTSMIYITGTSPSGFSCLQVFDKKGNKIHQLGEYARNDHDYYKARFYGGHGCGDGASASSIANKAYKNTKSKEGFLKVSSNLCLRIPDLSKRED